MHEKDRKERQYEKETNLFGSPETFEKGSMHLSDGFDVYQQPAIGWSPGAGTDQYR